jgi:hypothetical protein
MVKPIINSFSPLLELNVQKYERYLPTAFDDSLTLLEKVNKVIDYLNQSGNVTNDVITQWNSVMDWIMNEGLTSDVATKLDEWLSNGTINNIINTTGVVNVRNFGWIGNGVADDAIAIQNAIDSLPNGGTVIIPWTVTGTLISNLKLPSNITIFGYNTRLIAKLVYPVSGGSYPSMIFENKDTVNGNSNIKIYGCILDGQYQNGLWVEGTSVEQGNILHFKNVTNLTLDVEITNFRNNKNTANDPDSSFVGLFDLCTNVYLKNPRLNHVINGEGLIFRHCNNVVLDDVNFNNDQCWTPLHLYYCQGVTINKGVIQEESSNTASASTINMYSSDVLFKKVHFIGGKGVDIGDEYNQDSLFISNGVTFEDCVFDTQTGIYSTGSKLVKNVELIRCKFNVLQRAISIYAISIDGFVIDDCVSTTTDGTQVAYIFDTRNGSYMHNIQVIGGSSEGFDTGVKFYLRNGIGFKNVKIKNHRVKTSPLGTKLSSNGSSAGVFVYLYDTDLWTGNIYCQDFTISDCDFDVEGCPLLVAQATAGATSIDARNITVFNLRAKSTGVSMNRGLQINGFRNVVVDKLHVTDLSTASNNVASYCTDVNIQNTRLSYESIDPTTRPWRFEHSSGDAILQFNKLVNTGLVNNLFSQTTASTTFTNKIIGNNIPNTCDTF